MKTPLKMFAGRSVCRINGSEKNERDPELGWRLSFWDVATNQTLALFGRHDRASS